MEYMRYIQYMRFHTSCQKLQNYNLKVTIQISKWVFFISCSIISNLPIKYRMLVRNKYGDKKWEYHHKRRKIDLFSNIARTVVAQENFRLIITQLKKKCRGLQSVYENEDVRKIQCYLVTCQSEKGYRLTAMIITWLGNCLLLNNKPNDKDNNSFYL